MAKIHPQVYDLISKCYFYIGGYSFNYLVEIIDLFSMSKNFDIESKEKEVKEDFKKKHPLNDKQIDEYFSSQFSPNDRRNTYSEYVVNYLKSLEEVEIFKLLSDLLPHPKFKEMQWDSWNHKGEYVKSWRTDLIYYLNLCGVEYDFEKKEFKEINNGLNIQEAIFIPDLITIKFEDIFYKNLSNEINKCYKIGSHTSVFVLSRKLIENLLIDTLRKKYPINENNNIEIYYRSNGRRFHDFSVLLENLEKRKEDFGIDEPIINEFIRMIKPFRPQANSNAHSIIIKGRKEEIDSLEIESMAGLLLKLKNNIQR